MSSVSSKSSPAITRFAPSPTGTLHLGSARTALFNWLYARHTGGRFLLRIEDTDPARSRKEYVADILASLQWLGLAPDGEIVYQSQRQERHKEIAWALVESGHAYRCSCTPEEIEAMRVRARAEGRPAIYDGRCREHGAQASKPFIVRIKTPASGQTEIADKVQGKITVDNRQLDDFVILRADGSPTYMLCVVVDDHDMAVSHVIRGNDHLTNAARQYHLYRAMDWRPPVFAHIPLIHGAGGAKLSKRHAGSLTIAEYRALGYLPEALRNYLARLGWAHGDDEIFSDQQAREWFSLEGIGKSPARFDIAKLDNLNGHYIRAADPKRLAVLAEPYLAQMLGATELAPQVRTRLAAAMESLRGRAKTLQALADMAVFLGDAAPPPDDKSARLLTPAARRLLVRAAKALEKVEWKAETLEHAIRFLAETEGVKLAALAQPIRAALTGRTISPGIYDVLLALGKEISLARLRQE